MSWVARGPLRLQTLRLGDRQERGTLIPYSGWRTALLLGATACLALASLGYVVFADAFADDPGESPWPMRLVGTVGVVFFGVGLYLGVRRGWGRRWRVLLTPSAVVVAADGARAVVPWEAIRQVRATEVTTHVRGVAVREPLVGLDVSEPQAIQTGSLERLLLPLTRRCDADISLPIRTLDIDPRLLYQALRYYHQHPRPAANSRPRPDWHASSMASSPRHSREPRPADPAPAAGPRGQSPRRAAGRPGRPGSRGGARLPGAPPQGRL